MKKIWYRLIECLDNLSIRRKLYFLYALCVLFPLIVTDGTIFYSVVQAERTQNQHQMENASNAVLYYLRDEIDQISEFAKSYYLNKNVNQFLEAEYSSELDYFIAKEQFVKNAVFQESMISNGMSINLYVDNDTITNGGGFEKIEKIENKEWYKAFQESGQANALYFYYDSNGGSGGESKRRIMFLQKMDYYGKTPEKLLKLELDYGYLTRSLEKLNYDANVLLCMEDQVVLSNGMYTSVAKNFTELKDRSKVGYVKSVELYGTKLDICVLKEDGYIRKGIMNNMVTIVLLLFFNIFLPIVMFQALSESFTWRIRKLSEAFDRVEDANLVEIRQVKGRDEIGNLMINYNRMVRRINDLIQTVYKNTIYEQEQTVARQKAELLALHSQINPHFLFNTLESIRMHSIIKQEIETADMVSNLASLQRQYVEWGEDFIEVDKEMDFVKSYLELQKYRFGQRLSYQLEVEPRCNEIRIPKLSIVTFVENACVHGIENKAGQGWIFVRVYRKDMDLCLEIEDTGAGMSDEDRRNLLDQMENASIGMLQKKGSVGIINACLRLKMMTHDNIHFELESEEGMGTTVLVVIPKGAQTMEERIC